MSNNRIRYFDALKGFAIFLVVFCHHVVLSNETLVGNGVMSLAWGAVPCFFMVTGGVMHMSAKFSWKKYLMRLVKLYGVLVVWKLGYLCFYGMLRGVETDVWGLIKYLFFMGNLKTVDTGPMWFMYAYLQVMLIYPITHMLFYNGKLGKQLLLFLLVLLGGSSILSTALKFVGIEVDSLWALIPFGGYTNMMCYFVLGIFAFAYRDKIRKFLRKGIWQGLLPYIMVAAGTVGLMYIKFSYTGSWRWNGIYLDNGYYRASTMIIACGLYLVAMREHCPSVGNILSKVGKHTMGIFYLHYPVLVVYQKVCMKLVDNYMEYYSFGLNLVQTLVVVMICVGITICAKKIPIIKNLFI